MDRLSFSPPVAYVYNPLKYAWAPHETYLRKYANTPKVVIFLGMNPGPYGMVQTGVPFGEVHAVCDWMGIRDPVGKPEREHPQRPVLGCACPRSEVSGLRLWGLFAKRFGQPEQFFARHMVMNYCPLAFMESNARNRTPDKLPASEKDPLLAACDAHLGKVVEILKPGWVIGVGDFALKQAQRVFGDGPPKLGRILHPSPANPVANRNWAGVATKQLVELGVWGE